VSFEKKKSLPFPSANEVKNNDLVTWHKGVVVNQTIRYMCISSNTTNRLGGTLFIICKAQLHVSATNVGHLQVVNRKLINQLYMHL